MKARSLAQAFPFAGFVLLAYALSWAAWSLPLAAPGARVAEIGHVLGGFGPLAAALIMLCLRGQAIRPWFRGLWHWRLHPAWYLFALGFPVLLAVLATLVFVTMGGEIAPQLVAQRLPAYLPTLLMIALIGGGNEEPGWRGYALPILLGRMGPVAASFLLGVIWALWHLPLRAMSPGFAWAEWWVTLLTPETALLLTSITAHAFWYTWVLARTGSVLLCVLLHASYNAANGLLIPVTEAQMAGEAGTRLLWIMTGLVVASVLALVAATRGRLGAGSA